MQDIEAEIADRESQTVLEGIGEMYYDFASVLLNPALVASDAAPSDARLQVMKREAQEERAYFCRADAPAQIVDTH